MLIKNEKINSFALLLSKIDIKVVFFGMIFFGTFFYVDVHRLPFLPPIYLTIGRMIKFAILFLMIIYLIPVLFKRKFHIPINKYVIAIIPYMLACFLSLAVNPDNKQVTGRWDLIYLYYSFAVLLIMLYTLKNNEHKILIYAMMSLVLFNCVFSYIDMAVGFNNSIGKHSGLFGDRIYYGRLSTIISAYMIIMLLNTKSTLKKWLLLSGILFLLINILLLFQRGVYLAYFFAVLTIVLATKNKKIILAGIFASCILALLFGYMVMERMNRDKMGVVNMSDAGRVSSIHAGLNMWKAKPIFGVGHGTSFYRIRDYENISIIGINNQAFSIHNSYLVRLAETGLLGFITFTVFSIMILLKLIGTFKGKKNIVKECPLELFYTIYLIVFSVMDMMYPINFKEGYYWYLLTGAIILIRDKQKIEEIEQNVESRE